MAYTSLVVTHTSKYDAATNPLSSSLIPAYPEYRTGTTFDTTFYAAREASVDKLNG